ncbi:MAG: AAA family ATPase [Nostocoides sp.]
MLRTVTKPDRGGPRVHEWDPARHGASAGRGAEGTGQEVAATLERLDAELVGQSHAKRRLREIAASLRLDQPRHQFGMSAARPRPHMAFAGPPGTGKSTVARRATEILHHLGYVTTPRMHAITVESLVGDIAEDGFARMAGAMAAAAGGVLYIDQVRSTDRPDSDRQAAIDLLTRAVTTEGSPLVVIVAGSHEQVARLLAADEGLSSTVAHRITFEDYTVEQLHAIARGMLTAQRFGFDEGADRAFAEFLTQQVTQPRFANARTVRDAVGRARLRQARRLVQQDRSLTTSDLVTITESDVRG